MAKKRKATKKATKRKPAKKATTPNVPDAMAVGQVWKRKVYGKRVRIESIDGEVVTATLREGVPKKRIGGVVTFDKKDLLEYWEIV